MSCHPKHIELEPLELPPLERRQRLLQAARLRAQGLSLRKIGAQMDCAHGTVANYLEEFEKHRFHLVQSVAVDQLLDSILEVVAPNEELNIEVRDRLHAARELRLLLSSIPQLADHDEQQRQGLAQYEDRVRAWKEYAESEQQQHNHTGQQA